MPNAINSPASLFGKITAGYTHDIRNIFSIILESAGLMDDLVALCDDDTLPHRPKFLHSLSVLKTQINRGVDLTTRLNQFAHSADVETSQVDLCQLTANLVELMQRFGRLKEIPLEFDAPEPSRYFIITRPVVLQQVLFTVIERHLTTQADLKDTRRPTEEWKKLHIAIESRGDRLVVIIRPAVKADFVATMQTAGTALLSKPEFQARLAELDADAGIDAASGSFWLSLPTGSPPQ